MKILAIAGKNLASLAHEFRLDFRQEPLASAGLFAIYGPTGSGKSTLLDALCLALYGETPRLTSATTKGVHLPDVGDATITPRDPCNLLRRGAIDGWAEVDFMGNDGKDYRARWSVRRAYSKATGKLQQPEIALWSLPHQQSLGGIKREVLKTIESYLGLSFKQFVRAVLLAQNEFAAFLQSDDDDRASLLQTLTGLNICEGISISAFKRAKTEKQQLDVLQQKLIAQQPLSTEQRNAHVQQLATVTTAIINYKKLCHELEQSQQWHEQLSKLKHSEQEALNEYQQARNAQEQACSRRNYLARVEEVRAARPVLDTLDRLLGEVAEQQQDLAIAEQSLTAAQYAHQQALALLSTAQQALVGAENAWAAATSDLTMARQLDMAMAWLSSEQQTAQRTLTAAQQAASHAQHVLTQSQMERERLHAARQGAQEWLTTHQSWQTWAEDFARWDVLLGEAAKTQDELRGAEQAVQTAVLADQTTRRVFATATSECGAADQEFQRAAGHCQQTQQTLAQFDLVAVSEQRKTAEMRHRQLDYAAQLWQSLQSTLTRQTALQDESDIVTQEIKRTAQELTQILAQQPAIVAKLEQAAQSLKTAEAACATSVTTLRQHLATGTPCPVCGALEHPYVTGDAPSHAMLDSLTAAVNHLQQTQHALHAQEINKKIQEEKYQQRLTDLTQEAAALRTTIQDALVTWHTLVITTELAVIERQEYLAWFAAQQQRNREQLAMLDSQETAAHHAIKAHDEARHVRDRAQQQQITTHAALQHAQAAVTQATHVLQIAVERQAVVARQLQERLNGLDAVFAGSAWQSTWQAHPAAFREQWRHQVAAWHETTHNLDQWQRQLGILDTEINHQGMSVAEKTTQQQHAATVFLNIDQELQTKRQQRQTLFNGRAVDLVVASLTQDRDQARKLVQDQEINLNTATMQQTHAATMLKQKMELLLARQQQAGQAVQKINDWLAAFNLAHPEENLLVPQLRTLLAHDESWMMQERDALQAIANVVQTATAIYQERHTQRTTHEQQCLTLESAASVQTHLARITQDLKIAEQEALQIEITMRRDAECQEQAALIQIELTQQEIITAVWRKMDDLIGSADGKKFRNYAQQFTLDVLLSYANHHLVDLAPRYRLERVKDTLALMVVDQDMGDERRSVHSLSGGETFLVSLALALGLASLSSNRVRVESLFIDEGFGSLDAETLRVAMDALDNLQAQGRKVGVISHLREITERISVRVHVQRQSGGKSRVEVRV